MRLFICAACWVMASGSVPTHALWEQCKTQHIAEVMNWRYQDKGCLKNRAQTSLSRCWITSAGVVHYLYGRHCKISLTWLEREPKGWIGFRYCAVILTDHDAAIHRGAAMQLLLCEKQPVGFAYNLASNVASQVTPISFHRHSSESTLSSCDGLVSVRHLHNL